MVTVNNKFRAIRIIFAIVAVLGLFGMCCEDTSSKWLITLCSFTALWLFGTAFYIYFLNPKYFSKWIKSKILGVFYLIQIIIGCICHFVIRCVEFFKLVNKYHKSGDTYHDIFQAAFDAYKESRISDK